MGFGCWRFMDSQRKPLLLSDRQLGEPSPCLVDTRGYCRMFTGLGSLGCARGNGRMLVLGASQASNGRPDFWNGSALSLFSRFCGLAQSVAGLAEDFCNVAIRIVQDASQTTLLTTTTTTFWFKFNCCRRLNLRAEPRQTLKVHTDTSVVFVSFCEKRNRERVRRHPNGASS